MKIVASRDDFLGARNLFRRNVRPEHTPDNSATLFADRHSCGLKSALLWLRLRRAVLYRGLVIREAADYQSAKQQVVNLRYESWEGQR